MCFVNKTITNGIEIYFWDGVYLWSKTKEMKTISNETGSKLVNIRQDYMGLYRAMYVQVYNNEQQVLESKTFASIKTAEKWANKVLGIEPTFSHSASIGLTALGINLKH